MSNFIPKHLNDLVSSGKVVALRKNQVFQSSDYKLNLSLVKKGYIKRYTLRNDGTTSIQSIYGPGFFFPLTIVFRELFGAEINNSSDPVYYEAMTPAEIVYIDNPKLKRAVENDINVIKDILFVCSRRFEANIQRLDNSILDSAEKRVAHQLEHFAYFFGRKTKFGTLIQLPLTHQDIADSINNSRETVSKAIVSLKRRKLLTTLPGKKIVINDTEKLSRYIYS